MEWPEKITRLKRTFIQYPKKFLIFYPKRALYKHRTQSQLGNKNFLNSFTMTILDNDDKKGRAQVKETEELWSKGPDPKELYAQRWTSDVGRQRILWDLEKQRKKKVE